MAPTGPAVLTVAEFERILDPPSLRYELHHGQLALVPPPKKQHAYISRQLLLALTQLCSGWYVDKKLAFRPLPENEVWEADVAMVSEQRWTQTGANEWLSGSPDLVAEVLSPSNTAQENNDKEHTCFQGGCSEFWVVDPKLRTIRVSTPDKQARTYTVEDQIPLARFGGAALDAAEIFS